jgi:vanillate O-demethylase ferredoxin subunit
MRFFNRKRLLPLHRWTGMSAGLVLLLTAVSGALLLFRPQLEPVVDGQLLSVPGCVKHASIDRMTANAVAAYPSGRLDFIRIPASRDAGQTMPTAFVRFADKQTVYLNPCTGAVLGQRNRYSGLFGRIEGWHRLRFIEGGGEIVGAAALIAAVLLIGGGLTLWWPSTHKGMRSALRFAGGMTGGARRLSLHKSVGVFAGVIIVFSALTGAPQSFKWYKNALYAVTGSTAKEQPPQSAPVAGAARLPMDVFWQQVQQLDPDMAEAQLRYPVKKLDPIEIYMVGIDAPHPNARSYLYLDAYSGKVLAFKPYRSSSAGHKLYYWILSAHNGLIGGIVAKLLLLIGCLAVPVLAYTGISTFVRRSLGRRSSERILVRVMRKRSEARGICSFELADLSGKPLPSFGAGAHIDVHLRDGLVRQYSLCNHPAETHRYLIAVQRVTKSRGGSHAMHDEVHEGDVIEISPPRNHFPLAERAPHTLLLAGGIGVTPILCMAEQLAGESASFEMHYCAREAARAAFADRIRNSGFAARAFFHFSDGPPEQLIDIPALLARQPAGAHLYVCGPAGFMDVAIDNAMQLGWPEANLHREYFAGEVKVSQDDAEFDVKIASTGEIIPIPPGKTVLTVLSECGVDIPRSCEQGVCGTCATRVLEGEPDHRDLYLTPEERERNRVFLPCCSRARSSMLVLDL